MKFRAFSLFTFAFLLFSAATAAEKIPVDSRFILDGERKMRSWTFNSPESFKPYGTVEELMEKGLPGVRLVSAGKQTQVYSGVSVPVKAGEKYRVSAKVRGTGSGSFGFFMYGARWAWKGGNSDRFVPKAGLDGAPLEETVVIVIPEDVVSVRPHLCCYSGTVDFFDLKVERID